MFTSAVFAGICVFRVRLFYSTLLVRGGELTPSSFLPSVRDGIADRRGNVLGSVSDIDVPSQPLLSR